MFKTKNVHKKSFKNCHNCLASNSIDLINIKGQNLSYKKYNIKVCVDVTLLGCVKCHEYILGPNDCEMLDDACEYIINNYPDQINQTRS